MQCNGNFKQWFNIFLIISEAWQGYESKAYGVFNHNLKLQSKKLSRTRDIPNFPTQGWADTAFCTRKRSETYVLKKYARNIPFSNILEHKYNYKGVKHFTCWLVGCFITNWDNPTIFEVNKCQGISLIHRSLSRPMPMSRPSDHLINIHVPLI